MNQNQNNENQNAAAIADGPEADGAAATAGETRPEAGAAAAVVGPAESAVKALERRRNGNVARLPKAVRDRINRMIEDGVPYAEIIESLGEDGKGLDKWNLTRWKEGGYQDWLAERSFIERIRARQETPQELVREFDGTEVNHAALQLGSLHIFEALRELGPGSLNEKLGGDCAAFARLINALARASRETMLVQKYREACAQARAALSQLNDPNRKLTDEERRNIVRQVDEILGLASIGSGEAGDTNHGWTRADTDESPKAEGNGNPKAEGRNPKEGRMAKAEEGNHERHEGHERAVEDSKTPEPQQTDEGIEVVNVAMFP